MFVSPPPIPNIELLSQSTISSLGSRSFGGKISDVKKLTRRSEVKGHLCYTTRNNSEVTLRNFVVVVSGVNLDTSTMHP